MHCVVLVSRHSGSAWDNGDSGRDRAEDQPIENEPVYQIKQKGHPEGDEKGLEEVTFGVFDARAGAKGNAMSKTRNIAAQQALSRLSTGDLRGTAARTSFG
jgi:hypothetical protein